MAEFIEKTGKTVDEAFMAALAELGAAEDEVTMEVIEEPGKRLFGLLSKPAKVRVTKKSAECASADVENAPAEKTEEQVAAFAAVAEVMNEAGEKLTPEKTAAPVNMEAVERGRAFLAGIFKNMGLEVQMVTTEVAAGVKIGLVGEHLGILIGKHGQTLDAIQYLANLVANRGLAENRVRLIVDIEDYRERREETIVALALRLAEKACRTGRRVTLEPMNRHERKIIHVALQDNEKVTTFSAGEEPYRKVVIEPKGHSEGYGHRSRYGRGHRRRRYEDETPSEGSEPFKEAVAANREE